MISLQMNKCILGLNIHSICISTVFSICISIKYAQYLYFYHSHFEQTVWIVFAQNMKVVEDSDWRGSQDPHWVIWSATSQNDHPNYNKKAGFYQIYKKNEDFSKLTKELSILSRLQKLRIWLRWTSVVMFGCFWKLWPPCRMTVGQLVTRLKLMEKHEFH